MSNLIMRWFDWTETQGSMGLGRMFEYTEQPFAEQFSEIGQPAFDRLAVALPIH